MSDADAGAPQAEGGGLGDKIANLPTPVKLGAALGIAFIAFRWLKKRSAGNVGGASSDATTGVPTDLTGSSPGLGSLVGGLQGNTGSITGGTTDPTADWVAKARKALIGQGYSPVLAEQTIYDYLNGNPLSNTQTGALNWLLGVLSPPGNLPVFGTVPDPVMQPGPVSPPSQPPGQPQPVVTPPVVNPTPIVNKPPGVVAPLSAIQQMVNSVYAYLHRNPATYKGPTYDAATIAQATGYVKGGKATLPLGFTAPSGFTLNPTTRYLTPVPAPTKTTTAGGLAPVAK